MEFEQRLKKAIERGQRHGDQKAREEQSKKLTEEQFKRLHSQIRLELSEHIEKCVSKLPDHFPGFQFETIFGERGWGAACQRDDVDIGGGSRRNLYSRLEMTIRPYSHLHVVELAAKGTVRNKEIFNRTHFQEIEEADTESFRELIDVWVLEFAELYSARAKS